MRNRKKNAKEIKMRASQHLKNVMSINQLTSAIIKDNH